MPVSSPFERTASYSAARLTIRSITGASLSASAVQTEIQKSNKSFDSSQITKVAGLREITKNYNVSNTK